MLMGCRVKRREFLTYVGGAAVAWSLAARAQQADRMRRVGMLSTLTADDSEGQARVSAFRQALQQLGWTDGRNLQIDVRWSGGDTERTRKNAIDLAALAPDVILANWQLDAWAIAPGDPFRADRIRDCRRSGRCWLRR